MFVHWECKFKAFGFECFEVDGHDIAAITDALKAPVSGKPKFICCNTIKGKGVSKGLDRGKTGERFLLTCGASAGLAAAFHAPLAGVMFSLEEIHKNFSVSVLLSVMTASITADYLCSVILGVDSVFRFDIVATVYRIEINF